MLAFAFHLVPDTGETSMPLIDAASLEAAKALAVETVRRKNGARSNCGAAIARSG